MCLQLELFPWLGERIFFWFDLAPDKFGAIHWHQCSVTDTQNGQISPFQAMVFGNYCK